MQSNKYKNDVNVRKFNKIMRLLHPKIAKVVKERIIKQQKGTGYHDDSTCGYTCHSDGE
jgi:hypothetical protein